MKHIPHIFYLFMRCKRSEAEKLHMLYILSDTPSLEIIIYPLLPALAPSVVVSATTISHSETFSGVATISTHTSTLPSPSPTVYEPCSRLTETSVYTKTCYHNLEKPHCQRCRQLLLASVSCMVAYWWALSQIHALSDIK